MNQHPNTLHALLFSLLSGLIFGIGLILAGMANPAKVLAFLDLAGWWDPSLGASVRASASASRRFGVVLKALAELGLGVPGSAEP